MNVVTGEEEEELMCVPSDIARRRSFQLLNKYESFCLSITLSYTHTLSYTLLHIVSCVHLKSEIQNKIKDSCLRHHMGLKPLPHKV